MISSRVPIFFTIALTAAACHSTTAPSSTATLLVLAQDTSVSIGRTLSLTLAQIKGADTVAAGGTVSWTSSAEAVATVSSAGLVAALAQGTTTLTGTSSDGHGVMTLHVVSTRALTVGRGGSCVVRSDGRVYCWGGAGVQGAGNAASFPHLLPSPVPLTSIGVGYNSACGLSSDSEVYCWGDGLHDFPGGGTWRDTFTHVALPGKARDLSMGMQIACALTDAGQVYCWGVRTGGPDPVLVQGNLQFTRIAAGLSEGAGLTADGRLYWWDQTMMPDTLMSDRRFTDIEGEASFCGVTAQETLCWAEPFRGAMPRTSVNLLSGAPVLTQAAARPINSLHLQGCGLAAGGAGYCWGSNSQGEMGTGSTSGGDNIPPTAVNTSLRFITIHPGAGFTCALATNHRPYCWGGNALGDLGDGTHSDQVLPSPVRVP